MPSLHRLGNLEMEQLIAAEQLDRGEGVDGETVIAQLKARLQKNCEA